MENPNLKKIVEECISDECWLHSKLGKLTLKQVFTQAERCTIRNGERPYSLPVTACHDWAKRGWDEESSSSIRVRIWTSIDCNETFSRFSILKYVCLPSSYLKVWEHGRCFDDFFPKLPVARKGVSAWEWKASRRLNVISSTFSLAAPCSPTFRLWWSLTAY